MTPEQEAAAIARARKRTRLVAIATLELAAVHSDRVVVPVQRGRHRRVVGTRPIAIGERR